MMAVSKCKRRGQCSTPRSTPRAQSTAHRGEEQWCLQLKIQPPAAQQFSSRIWVQRMRQLPVQLRAVLLAGLTDRRHHSNHRWTVETRSPTHLGPPRLASPHYPGKVKIWARLTAWNWSKRSLRRNGSVSILSILAAQAPLSCAIKIVYSPNQSMSRRRRVVRRSLSKFSTPFAIWRTIFHC